MTWTTPITYTDGIVITATHFNAYVSGNLRHLYRVIRRKTADQTVTTPDFITDLAVPDVLEIGEVWVFKYSIIYTLASSGGQVQINVVDGGGAQLGSVAVVNETASNALSMEADEGFPGAGIIVGDVTASEKRILIKGLLEVDDQGINIRLTAGPSNSGFNFVAKAGSSLVAERVVTP